MTLAIMMVAVCASAQVYLGGTVGIASVGGENSDDETAFKILPEIGYNLSNDWAIGTTIGYSKGTAISLLGSNSMLDASLNGNDAKAFVIKPYARYTFLHSKMVNLFLDLGLGFAAGKVDGGDFTAWNVGIQPGVAVNLNQHFSFVGKVGFLGYEAINPDGDNNNSHAFGLDVNGNNITFGLYYNF